MQEPGPKRQLNIALGILLPAPVLAQKDEQGCAAAAYHQLLCLSVCPSAATVQTRRSRPSCLLACYEAMTLQRVVVETTYGIRILHHSNNEH